MARRKTPDARPRLADPVSNLRVTVVPGPRGQTARDRWRVVRVALGLLVIAGLIAFAAVAGTNLGGQSRTDRGATSAVAARGARVGDLGNDPRDETEEATGDAGAAAGAAAAYRYPLGCLGITLSADRSALLGRHNPCWHYGVYVTAVLRKVNGVWRLVLQATSRSCPAIALPHLARLALAVCTRATPPGLRALP